MSGNAMPPVLLDLPRFVLRDFEEADRMAFLSCQADPRYCRLYDFDPADAGRADRLFDLFRRWRSDDPRENFQLGIFEETSGGLCGNAGLRRSGNAAIFGIELCPDQWGRFRLALDASAALLGFGFDALKLEAIGGATASGNLRVERLARRFGARS
jgi:[ribosomal protein S5]-alanine N-acetyltransferase